MRVLLVEDEKTLAETLAAGLRADGFTVDIADDGVDALARVQTTDYDAIVLDIMLPGISGYEVVCKLRGAGVWIPVLMLTAKDGEYDEADALDLGADDYLTKPFSYVVLLAHLRAVIRRGAPERPVASTAGDLILDPGARTCRRAATTIDLTPREFSVLECLMRRRDQVVSKPAVWLRSGAGHRHLVRRPGRTARRRNAYRRPLHRSRPRRRIRPPKRRPRRTRRPDTADQGHRRLRPRRIISRQLTTVRAAQIGDKFHVHRHHRGGRSARAARYRRTPEPAAAVGISARVRC